MNENRKYKIGVALAYLAVILVLQLVNGWYENFSDATNYLWLADRYAEGDFKQAVNTYWGPMTSWLLLLLKPFFANPFFRFRILQLILGMITLYVIHSLLIKQLQKTKSAFFYTLLFVPLIASYAWFYLTPDLLLLLFALTVVKQLLEEKEHSVKESAKLAFLGALLYFAKSAGIYFFILLVAGKFICERKQWNLRSLRFNLLTAFFLFLFCAPWIALISKKHGSLTLGTGSIHNYKLNSPRITPDIYGELGSPFNLGTLTAPNPITAFDAWGEPAHQSYLSWEGMSKEEIRAHYFKVIIKNIKSARSMFFGLDPGLIFFLLFLTAMVLARNQLKRFLADYNPLFLLFIANFLIYVPFFFMYRYTWPGAVAFMLLTVLLLERISAFHTVLIRMAVSGAMGLLVLLAFYKDYHYTLPEKKVLDPIWKTEGKLGLERTAFICLKGDMRLSLVGGLTYYNHGQYFGALFSNETPVEDIKAELKRCRITNLVCFDEEPVQFVLKNIENRVLFSSAGLTVFRIDPLGL